MSGFTYLDCIFLTSLIAFITGVLLYSTKLPQKKEQHKMLRVFQQVYNMGPALAANHTASFKTPFDCQLTHVSLCNSTANVGTLKIGHAGDDDAYLKAENFGASGAPAVVDTPAGFDGEAAGGHYPHIPRGTTVLLTVTDHASHMANVCVVLTFTEG